jgi:hypothetical protein
VSRGIDPEVKSLCRDAARAINRYPVKDPLIFETADEDEEEEEEEEEEGEEADIDDEVVV